MIVLGFGYQGSKNVIILQTIDGLVKTYLNTIKSGNNLMYTKFDHLSS